MTKIEMVAGVLHAARFNSSWDECYGFARMRLLAEAGSELALQRWDAQVSDEIAKRYIEERAHVTSVRWANLHRELQAL